VTRYLRALLFSISITLATAAAPAALAQDHEGGGDPPAGEAEHHEINWWGRGDSERPALGWQIIDVLLLLVVLVWLARKPATEFFAKRRADIADKLAEAERIKAEAEAKYAEYQKRLSNMGAELEELKDEIIKAGEVERDRMVVEAERKAARLRKDAEFVVEQRIKQLQKDLRAEMVQAAVEAAGKVLAERTTDADQEKLTKDFIAKLGPLAKSGKVVS
jgi:F-type H+-transporting ATPase subunit b